MRVSVSVTPPTSPAVARDALATLAGMHDALRSRLVREADGGLVQEVVDGAEMIVDEIESTPNPHPVDIRPEEHAARARLHMRGDAVVVVELTVSHVFCDGMGRQVLARDLDRLLRGALPDGSPGQARAYAYGPDDPRVRRNTDHWKRLLVAAPRSCTYAPMRRQEHEKVSVARIPLTAADLGAVAAACRQVRTTPNAVWATAASVVVGRMCGQHRHVFRSTYANRVTKADLDAVAQLAQAVFLPVVGSETDSLGDRTRHVTKALVANHGAGMYDANGLLDWLNQPERSRGAVFQPAFEVTYVPRLDLRTDVLTGHEPGPTLVEEDVRVDPSSAKADLVVLVAHSPDPNRCSGSTRVGRSAGTVTR
ncbi:hypothetical protein GCM10029964_052800 [Kibdelosporangium lantanae]